MKVLQVNVTYGYGSTGKITCDISRYLTSQNVDNVVCYGRRQGFASKKKVIEYLTTVAIWVPKKETDSNVHKISSELGVFYHKLQSTLFSNQLGFSQGATRKLINIIKEYRPDVVHLHCLNGYFVNVYRLLEFLKESETRTVLTLHAEFMYTAGCGYAFDCEKWKTGCEKCRVVQGLLSRFYRDDAKRCFEKIKEAFDGFHRLEIVGCSRWISDRAKCSPILSEFPIRIIHNGIDVDVFQYTDPEKLRNKLGIPRNKKIILSVTPNFKIPLKGGKYLIECAKRLNDFQFIVIGFDGDKSVLPENVLPIAYTSSKKELAEFYSLADCLLLTSLRDNYPTVAIEATSCGRPVVGFRTGGVPETIPEGMGECVDCFDVNQMLDAIKRWSNTVVSSQLVDTIRRKNSWVTMGEAYLNLYKN